MYHSRPWSGSRTRKNQKRPGVPSLVSAYFVGIGSLQQRSIGMLRIDRVLETALYVKDMARAIEFYQRIFGFDVLLKSAEPDRLTALEIGGAQVLLLCRIGASLQAVATPGGKIPPCDPLSQLETWEKHLEEN